MQTNLIVPSAYFPNLEYMSQIVKSQKIFIDTYVPFSKFFSPNKCEIYAANGKLTLTVPIKKFNSAKTRMNQVQISYDTDWQRLHFKSIESAYRSSAFYEFYIDAFLPFFNQKYQFLLDFNAQLLKTIVQELGIESQIFLTTEDLRNAHYENDSKKDEFKFLTKNKFFLQGQYSYYQIFENKFGFIPNLSILDLLFNEGPYARDYLQNI